MGLAVVLYLRIHGSFQLGVYRDDSSYVVLAHSFLQADRYGLMNMPGQPGATQFPFGFPLLLAALLTVLPGHLDALPLISLMATLFNGALIFWGWRLVCARSYWWALGLTAMYLLSPLTVDHTRMVMSEPVFTTFCLSAIGLTSRRAALKPGRLWGSALASFLVFALATRTVGIILVAACLFGLIAFQKRYFIKTGSLISVSAAVLLTFIVAATPVAWSDLVPAQYLKILTSPFAGEQVMDPAPSSHEQIQAGNDLTRPSFATWLIEWTIIWGAKQHLGKDLRDVAVHLGDGGWVHTSAERAGLSWLPLGIGFVVSMLVFLGLVRLWSEEKRSVFVLFGILYIVLLFGWGGDSGRLLYPVQPQIHLGLMLGLESLVVLVGGFLLGSARAQSYARIVLVGMVLLLVVTAVGKSWQINDSRIHAGDLRVRTAWVSANSHSDDVIMSGEPQTDYLYGGRKTVEYPWSVSGPADLRRYMNEYQVTYALVAPKVEWQTPNFVPRYDDDTARVLQWLITLEEDRLAETVYWSDPDLIRVFRVAPSAAPPSGSAQ